MRVPQCGVGGRIRVIFDEGQITDIAAPRRLVILIIATPAQPIGIVGPLTNQALVDIPKIVGPEAANLPLLRPEGPRAAKNDKHGK